MKTYSFKIKLFLISSMMFLSSFSVAPCMMSSEGNAADCILLVAVPHPQNPRLKVFGIHNKCSIPVQGFVLWGVKHNGRQVQEDFALKPGNTKNTRKGLGDVEPIKIICVNAPNVM